MQQSISGDQLVEHFASVNCSGRFLQVPKSMVWGFTTLFAVVAFSGCGGSSSGAATPEAAFKQFADAFKSKEYEKAINQLDKDSQKMMAGTMVLGAAFIAAFSPDADGLKKILKDHGIDQSDSGSMNMEMSNPRDGMIALGAKVKDPAKFVGAMFKWMDENGKVDAGKQGLEIANATLSDLKIDGEKATAKITVAGKATPIEFRKVDNVWKLHFTDEMMNANGGGGSSVSSNSGDAFVFPENDFEESDELPPSEPISLDEFNQAWQLSAPLTGKTAGELIQELAQQCNLQVNDADTHAAALAKQVAVETDGKSRLQLLEEIAGQVGVQLKYKLRSIEVKGNKRPSPVEFVGPLMIELASVRTQAPYPVGNIEIRCLGAGLPTRVVSRVKELNGFGSNEKFELVIDEISSGGEDLRRSNASGGFGFNPMFTKSGFRLSTNISLMNLLRRVEKIDTLKGAVKFSLVSKVKIIKFVKQGDEVKHGEGTLTLKRLGRNVSVAFKNGDVEFSIVGRDDSGNVLEGQGASSFSFGNGGERSQFFDQEPASAEIVVVEKKEDFNYPFEFKDIPVPGYEKMPERMVELEFTGKAPISFAFTKIETKDFGGQQQKNAVFNATNNSNKSITGFQLTMHYLDANGKKLKDAPYSYGGTADTFPGPGKSQSMDMHMAFAPAETAKVTIDVDSMVFADGTEWEADSE